MPFKFLQGNGATPEQITHGNVITHQYHHEQYQPGDQSAGPFTDIFQTGSALFQEGKDVIFAIHLLLFYPAHTGQRV
jgi:hypothetical protein